VRDCPKEIKNLRKEHDSLASAIERFRSLVQSGDDVKNVSLTFVEQIHTVIGGTKKTLDELEAAAKTLQLSKDNCVKRAALHTIASSGQVAEDVSHISYFVLPQLGIAFHACDEKLHALELC